MTKEEIQRQLVARVSGGRKKILANMLADFEGNEQTNVCVASFSTASDSLSQWRAYGGQKGAFAIGFNGDHIISLLPKHHFHLVPCIYESRKQRVLITSLIAKVYDEISKARHSGKVHPRKGGNLAAYLHRYAPILKDSSFSDEREWRIISRPLMNGLDDFAFREGNSMLIPYYQFPLEDAGVPFKLVEVVVGPTPDPTRSVASVRNFLVSEGLDAVTVRSSTVPYRNW
jgi:hypothetical protein